MNYVLEGRNVNHLWARAVPLIYQIGERSSSRAGDVLVAPHPVMSVTHAPTERVLFDPARDANPFFHFFECLWMMAGRADAAFLDRFVGNFGERFAEKNGMLWGAYGFRWRHSASHTMTHDQIEVAVRRLNMTPDDRRTVISMWDPMVDLWDPEDRTPDDMGGHEPRDLPCNTHIYLRLRESYLDVDDGDEPKRMLDMTVCCRSNDIVWGAYGANAVHFSFLQEYLAGRLGVGVGKMYQLSNNWHAYVPVLERYAHKIDSARVPLSEARADPYSGGTVSPMPIGDRWGSWDADLRAFMEWAEGRKIGSVPYVNSWFGSVAVPMFAAHIFWKQGECEAALRILDDVAASDWARAAREWMLRRTK